ncbi:hypothetical protein SNEBB_010513 [Seison nebaliae]|nr:hypothetical protein SNEBB_010513 [Seison nebaliae]
MKKSLKLLSNTRKYSEARQEWTRLAKHETISSQSKMNERLNVLRPFYNQSEIDNYLQKKPINISAMSLMYRGVDKDGAQILRSAQYLQNELLVRISRTIYLFRQLPFILGCNGRVLKTHEQYIESFNELKKLKRIENLNDEKIFRHLLIQRLSEHSNVIDELAAGLKEARRYSDDKTIKTFLDELLVIRLSLRILSTHHVKLFDEKAHNSNWIGVICKNFHPQFYLRKWTDYVSKIASHKYGISPAVIIDGHVDEKFPFVPLPLDYIIPELLKNAYRATIVGKHLKMKKKNPIQSDDIPSIHISLSVGPSDFRIRIRDRGNGMTNEVAKKIFDYHFTTSDPIDNRSKNNINNISFDTVTGSDVVMHGYGFGLPIARAYARYLKGDIIVQTLHGVGTDVYLILPLLTESNGENKIMF